MCKRCIATIVALVSVFSTFAANVEYRPGTYAYNGAWAWTGLQYWFDLDTQAAATDLPTNLTDTVYLSSDRTLLNKYGGTQPGLYAGWSDGIYGSQEIRLATLIAEPMWTIYNSRNFHSGDAADSAKVFSVLNPNGFEGYFYSAGGHNRFEFPADGGFTPRIRSLSANGRARINLPTAGKTVEIGNLFDSGSIEKQGAGELALDVAPGQDTILYLKEGAVSIKQPSHGQITPVLSQAYLHLDATDASTLIGPAELEEGRTSVTNWLDVRKNGRFAYVPGSVYRIPNPGHPFVAKGAAANGLDMVDFGTMYCDLDESTAFGPTNCFMHFERRDDYREFFYVVRYHQRPSMNSVIGDTTGAPLQPCETLLGGSANWGIRTGAIFVDAHKVSNFWPDSGRGLTNLHVYGFGSLSNVTACTIASDQDRPVQAQGVFWGVGGMQIGEILIYTNELTRNERDLVNRYLTDKWLMRDASSKGDTDAEMLAFDGGSLKVASGQELKVPYALTSSSNGLVKTGAGTLSVGRVYPRGAELEVQEGALHLDATAVSVTSNAPAAGASVWLDATVAESRPETLIDDLPYVLSWTDCRGGDNAVTAVAPTDQLLTAPHCPTLSTDVSPTGLKTISMGNGNSNITYMTFPWHKTDTSTRYYAGFVVMKLNMGNYNYVSPFGSYDWTFMRNSGNYHGSLCSYSFVNPTLASAFWTLNGVPQDPLAYNSELNKEGRYRVISFCAKDKVLVDGLAVTGYNHDYYGGISLGEVLLYDRPLSTAERRNTEAYLLSKWMGQVHPDVANATQAHAYKFAAAQPAVIDSNADLELTGLTGGNGNFVKRGTGTVEIGPAQFKTGDIQNLSVEAGAVKVSLDYNDDAYYHFDASDFASFTDYTVENGKTNVHVWADTDGRDLCATNYFLQYAPKVPSYKLVTFPDGKVRPGLDFYGFISGAALKMTKTYAGAFKEGLTVYQNPYNNWQCSIFSTDDNNYNSSAPYNRNSSSTAVDYGCLSNWQPTRDGYFWVDGVVTNGTYTGMRDGNPHLVDTIPTIGITINTLSMHQCFGGGQVVFEQIGFTNQLSAARREWWQRHLRYKWFGEGSDPVWTNFTLQAVNVAAGATLHLDNSSDTARLIAEELGGAGLIEAEQVAPVNALSFTKADVLSASHLTVTGAIDFDAAVEVDVSGMVGRDFANGEYTLLEADDLGEINLENWSLTGLDDITSRSFKLKRVEESIVLVAEKLGMIMIVK